MASGNSRVVWLLQHNMIGYGVMDLDCMLKMKPGMVKCKNNNNDHGIALQSQTLFVNKRFWLFRILNHLKQMYNRILAGLHTAFVIICVLAYGFVLHNKLYAFIYLH